MTTEKQCSCESEFQDRTYGKRIRVFNMSGKNGVHIARCTVCRNSINLFEAGSSKVTSKSTKKVEKQPVNQLVKLKK